jgi:hypothetical protein
MTHSRDTLALKVEFVLLYANIVYFPHEEEQNISLSKTDLFPALYVFLEIGKGCE